MVDLAHLNNLCKKALDSWGFDAQMDMVLEEMSELSKAILKYRRKPSVEKANDIAEEMADVIIMMNQLNIAMVNKYPDFNNRVNAAAKYKISRLEEMLKQP